MSNICARKALVADLELEYERDSDSLTVHQYDIKGVKEEVCKIEKKNDNRPSILYKFFFRKISGKIPNI
ncbi:hypothetical protein HPULCUR_007853 [Helicostylum pulchrum]|uniref:Uncharacterized protein n=1 Tax=Helicostylum pulchrum TaxID=562976 RepID=A0ABP9Y719_9FUNG